MSASEGEESAVAGDNKGASPPHLLGAREQRHLARSSSGGGGGGDIRRLLHAPRPEEQGAAGGGLHRGVRRRTMSEAGGC